MTLRLALHDLIVPLVVDACAPTLDSDEVVRAQFYESLGRVLN